MEVRGLSREAREWFGGRKAGAVCCLSIQISARWTNTVGGFSGRQAVSQEMLRQFYLTHDAENN